MNDTHKQLARELLRLDDLNGARAIAEAAIETAQNPWPYRLALVDLQRLAGQRDEALIELDRLAQADPPANHDTESWIGIARLRGSIPDFLASMKSHTGGSAKENC